MCVMVNGTEMTKSQRLQQNKNKIVTEITEK